MHDHWLIAIAIATAALGVVGLLFALLLMEAPETAIGRAQALPDSTPVRVKGMVKAVAHRGNVTIITVEQPATIEVTIFEPNLTADGCVIATGRKGTYKGHVQLTATRLQEC